MQTRKGSGALHWETEKHEARARGGCRGGRCALRTVTEHLRQTAEAPYVDFERHVRPLARERRRAALAVRGDLERRTRRAPPPRYDADHFSDAGRRFLAQLTLNALPVLLPPRRCRP